MQFKQLIDENKQLIDEKDVCMQTGANVYVHFFY